MKKHPERDASDVAFKLKVIEYSSKTSNREAGRKFG